MQCIEEKLTWETQIIKLILKVFMQKILFTNDYNSNKLNVRCFTWTHIMLMYNHAPGEGGIK